MYSEADFAQCYDVNDFKLSTLKHADSKLRHSHCLQDMAEICANGYRDALRFLQENSKKLQKWTTILDLQ